MSQHIFNLKSDALKNDTSLKFDLYQPDVGVDVNALIPTFQVLEQDIKVQTIGQYYLHQETHIVSTTVVDRTLIVNLNKSIINNISAGESIIFRKFVNKVDTSLIGYDKNTIPVVDADLPLNDYFTGNTLVDNSSKKPLTVPLKGYAKEAAYVNRATSIVAATNPNIPLKIQEMFPETSQVSTTLLGVTRGERQLGLFSDVSVMGLDADIWEVGAGGDNYANSNWYHRKTKDKGNYYTGTVQEVTAEQALRLACYPVKYPYPGPVGSSNYDNFKRFIELGHNLYTFFNTNHTGYPINFKDNFLSPTLVTIETLYVRDLKGQIIQTYADRLTFKGITEDQGLLLIDIWTKTFDQIKLQAFIDPSTNAPLLDIVLIEKLNNANPSNPPYPNSNPFNTAVPGNPPKDFVDNVSLTSKRTFRYQPGRISGFTFGIKATSDSGSAENAAEWGIYNPTDELLFQLRGNNMNIVRRSTVPLPYEVMDSLRYYNQTSYLQKDPDTGTEYTMYEYALPKSKWNRDTMDGNGPSGYLLNPDYVTMYKIEFSWYGAIGANFYVYVPIGNKDARWVLVHRMVIENKMSQAWLQDAFFKFKFSLLMRNSTFTNNPQFLYKYGSSYYIDGGDEGTNTYASTTTETKTIDSDSTKANIILGISPKTYISDSVGVQKRNKKLIIPKNISATSTKSLIKLDVVNCKACPGFGFTYDQGIQAPTVNPASKQLEFRFNTNTKNNRLVLTTRYSYPISAIDYSTTSVYLTVLKDSFYKKGDKFKFTDLTYSSYLPLTASIYNISNVYNNPVVVGIPASLTLAITGQSFSPFTPAPPASALNIRLFSQMLGVEDHNSKILVNGLYGYYLDTETLRSFTQDNYNSTSVNWRDYGGSSMEEMEDTSISDQWQRKYYNCVYLYNVVGSGKKTPLLNTIMLDDRRFVSTPSYYSYINNTALSASVISSFDGYKTDYYLNLNYYNINGTTGPTISATPYYFEKATISNFNNSIAISDYAITSPKATIRFLYNPNTYSPTGRHYSDFRLGVTTKKPIYNAGGALGIDVYSHNLSAQQAGGITKFVSLSDRADAYSGRYVRDPRAHFLFTEFTPSTIVGTGGFSYGETIETYRPYNITTTNIPNTYSNDGGTCSKVDISFTKNVTLTGFTSFQLSTLLQYVDVNNIPSFIERPGQTSAYYRTFLASPDPRFGNITNLSYGMFTIPSVSNDGSSNMDSPDFNLDDVSKLKTRIAPGSQRPWAFVRNGSRGSYVRGGTTYYYAEVDEWFSVGPQLYSWYRVANNFSIRCHLLTLTYTGATTTSTSKMYPTWNALGDLNQWNIGLNGSDPNDYNYETDPFPLYPAVQLLDGASINSISIQETNDTASTTTAPHWLSGGNIIIDNVGGLAGTNDPNQLLASIPEVFSSQKRLEAAQYDINCNRAIRKSLFTGKLATTMASFYIGASSTKTIALDKIFNVDRNVITQDSIGSNAVFFTAKNININGNTVNDNKVQITLNVAEQ